MVGHAATGVGQPSNTSSVPSFTITNTISSSPTNQTSALLYPGLQRYLWYTVNNPQMVPITVTSMSVSNVLAPLGCPLSNLDMSQTTFSSPPYVPLFVPALRTSSVAVPISLINTNSNQDSCENTEYTFSFVGVATYTEIYGTVISVDSTLNPSLSGQSVTYTATVTASAGAGQDPVPSSPTGTVTFMDGSSTICSSASLTSASPTTSMATCDSPVYVAPGPHSVTEIYSNADGNFSGSTSPILDQIVAP